MHSVNPLTSRPCPNCLREGRQPKELHGRQLILLLIIPAVSGAWLWLSAVYATPLLSIKAK